MPDERIKVIFQRVYVLRDADTFGSGEFYFIVTVAGQPVGDRNRIFNAVEHRTIDLPEDQWHAIVDVRSRTTVPIYFAARDQDLIWDDDLGRLDLTLRLPFTQQRHTIWRHRTRYFMLNWEVQLSVGGGFGRHPPSSIFACREHAGSVRCSTVSGTHFHSRGEIHPVIPVPVAPPASQTPARPGGLPGVAWTGGGANNVAANSPMNVIPNPAVIPRLNRPPAGGPPAAATPRDLDYAAYANTRNCARLEFTFYQPNTLNFQPNDRRLEWQVVSVSGGGNADFLGDPRGRQVLAYGTHDGEVRFEVRFQGALFATYRALVRQVQPITCRFTIFNGPTAARQPRATPDDVRNHFEIANRIIRQLGIQLRLDTDPTRTHGATATTHPGIFRIRCSANRTWRIPSTGWSWASRRNARDSILNFCYIHSDRDGNLGAGESYPASNAGNNITDPPAGDPVANATPSTAWIPPSGVAPAPAAVRQTMTLIPARLHPHQNTLRSMYVTDANGNVGPGGHTNPQALMTYAGTIAHELGHMLNLGHRVEGTNAGVSMVAGTAMNLLVANGQWWDGLLHPYNENVMHWSNGSNIAQDFDLIQARAVHESPLVPTV